MCFLTHSYAPACATWLLNLLPPAAAARSSAWINRQDKCCQMYNARGNTIVKTRKKFFDIICLDFFDFFSMTQNGTSYTRTLLSYRSIYERVRDRKPSLREGSWAVHADTSATNCITQNAITLSFFFEFFFQMFWDVWYRMEHRTRAATATGCTQYVYKYVYKYIFISRGCLARSRWYTCTYIRVCIYIYMYVYIYIYTHISKVYKYICIFIHIYIYT